MSASCPTRAVRSSGCWSGATGSRGARIRVRSKLLSDSEPDESGPPEYLYGKVIVPTMEIRREPSVSGPVLDHHRLGQILAFKPLADPTGEWLERPDGTFVA